MNSHTPALSHSIFSGMSLVSEQITDNAINSAIKVVALIKRATLEEQKARALRREALAKVAEDRKELRAVLAQKRAALSSLAAAPAEAARKYLAADQREQELRRIIEQHIGSELEIASSLQKQSNALIKAAKLWSLALPLGEASDQSVEEALATLALLRK